MQYNWAVKNRQSLDLNILNYHSRHRFLFALGEDSEKNKSAKLRLMVTV